jgi:hypothetical protein
VVVCPIWLHLKGVLAIWRFGTPFVLEVNNESQESLEFWLFDVNFLMTCKIYYKP